MCPVRTVHAGTRLTATDPHPPRALSQWDDADDDAADDDTDDDDADAAVGAAPAFPELDAAIDAAIARLGGVAFPKVGRDRIKRRRVT